MASWQYAVKMAATDVSTTMTNARKNSNNDSNRHYNENLIEKLQTALQGWQHQQLGGVIVSNICCTMHMVTAMKWQLWEAKWQLNQLSAASKRWWSQKQLLLHSKTTATAWTGNDDLGRNTIYSKGNNGDNPLAVYCGAVVLAMAVTTWQDSDIYITGWDYFWKRLQSTH